MNPNTKEVIEQCAHESQSGLLSFAQALGRLIEVGVESYFADYRNHSTTYYLSNNEVYTIPMDIPIVEIQSEFQKEGLVSAIRGAQSNTIKYPEFVKLTISAGCMGYIVWITGRHVSYFGRRGEVHVEHFPQK